MKYKNVGILVLLLVICVVTTLLNGRFVSVGNLQSLLRSISLFGFCSIGVAFVIITGGIDLSIGSVIALTGCLLIMFLDVRHEATGSAAQVAEIVLQDRAPPIAAPAMRVEQIPEGLAAGDRLTFPTTYGVGYVTVREVATVGQEDWLLLRDNPGQLTVGASVELEKLTHTPVWIALAGVLAVALGIGLVHGLLVTRANLQPFVVTLCGLLLYRGIARVLTDDDQIGLGSALQGFKQSLTGPAFHVPVPFLRWISEGDWGRYRVDPGSSEQVLGSGGEPLALDLFQWVPIPVPGVLLVLVGVVAWFWLNRMVWGRHLLALGRSEQAARYSGIATERLVVSSYVISSGLAGLAGILFALDLNNVQPATTGNFYELYAIAAAVLGGCSLRGGEGSIPGVIVGTAVMQGLYQSIKLLGVPETWEYVIIGLALLLGVVADEVVRRITAARRMRQATD